MKRQRLTVRGAAEPVQGVVAATDAVSGCIWVIDDQTQPTRLFVVRALDVVKTEDLGDMPADYSAKLDAALQALTTVSPAQVAARQAAVLRFFRQNGVSASVRDVDGAICAFDCLELRPPYGLDDVVCDNAAVLRRFVDLYERHMRK